MNLAIVDVVVIFDSAAPAAPAAVSHNVQIVRRPVALAWPTD